ncbi:MAG: CDP-alcohol phosphatidyltransferase family protein [Promethearchaeota archaeon]|jgi:phosphatidylglycerophosphate synthase
MSNSKFRLRYIFKPLINLIAKGLVRLGVTPNSATVIMLCFSILSFVFLVFFQNLIGFAISVFLTGIWDGLDGQIARLTNKTTKYGGFFDSSMDRISEFIIFMGLLIFSWDFILWNIIDVSIIIYISFLSSVMISYSRARAEVFLKGDFDIGLMARSERLFFIFISMFFAFFFGFVSELLFIFMCLVIGTFAFRVIRVYYFLKKEKTPINE